MSYILCIIRHLDHTLLISTLIFNTKNPLSLSYHILSLSSHTAVFLTHTRCAWTMAYWISSPIHIQQTICATTYDRYLITNSDSAHHSPTSISLFHIHHRTRLSVPLSDQTTTSWWGQTLFLRVLSFQPMSALDQVNLLQTKWREHILCFGCPYILPSQCPIHSALKCVLTTSTVATYTRNPDLVWHKLNFYNWFSYPC